MIEVKSLNKSFGNNAVLRGVDLNVSAGESLSVIGGSGSGKSVLIKCILGLITPDSGSIKVNGNNKVDMDQIGMLFQGGALFDSLSVWENVAFRPLQQRMPRSKARDLAVEKLARVGLSANTADLYPAELSGGMQKRAGLARAIAGSPDLLFFDEPTTGLDPIKGGMINRLIRDILTETGATAVTISHDLNTVRTVSDRVAMIFDGQIHWNGPTADLDRSGDPTVEQFVTGAAEGPFDPLA